MGTWAEEKFHIEQEVERFQMEMKRSRTAPDYEIRAAEDSLPEDQDGISARQRRPHLRWYQVEELLHLQ